MGIFNRSSKNQANKTSNSRQDGYNDYAAKIACEFQAIIEHEIEKDFAQGIIDAQEYKNRYAALAASLLKSRVQDANGKAGFVATLVNFRAAYNDTLINEAQIAYNAR